MESRYYLITLIAFSEIMILSLILMLLENNLTINSIIAVILISLIGGIALGHITSLVKKNNKT